MNRSDFQLRLRELSAGDKRLLLVCFAAALIALALGVLFGAATGLVRARLIDLPALEGYRLMTLHGVTVFFYWLYFAQAGLLLVFSVTRAEGGDGIAWRPAAWAGVALMIAGFVLSETGAARGLPLLYDASPELTAPGTPGTASVYLGYLLLAAGLFGVAAAAVATVLAPVFAGRSASLTTVGFASLSWAGLLAVSALAAVNAFLPAARWALGMGPTPQDYSTGWHILFHNMHYLPLMATVLTWYVIVQLLTGVESIFGARFSKIVFASYLVFVPPTSLYHMFLEPNLAGSVRVAGSLLSLFISVPTVLVFLIIVASLETHARARGALGLFGWMRQLPWRNPAMSAIGMAVLTLAAGGALSFVLIQEKLAPLLSDTFFVPGYFHFLTVGTVTLTFLGALCYVLPAITGRPLWRPGLLANLSYWAAAGVTLFGAAGVAAGYLGVPRRMLDVCYEGAAPGIWALLLSAVGIGGVVMALALLVYVFGLVRSALPRASTRAAAPLPEVDLGGVALDRSRAWTGPLSILVLIGVMAIFTMLAFETMKALPLAAIGGAAH